MSKLEELIQKYCPDGVEFKPLKDVLKIKNGRDYKHLGEGSIPVYGSGGVMTYVDTPIYSKPSVLIPRKGSIDKLYYVDAPFWNVDTVFYTEIDTTQVVEKYVFYVLQKEHLEKLNTAGGVPSLTQGVLNEVMIPVPPLPVQEEIVRVLDTFTELQAELQAELQKRVQQYQYYLNVLLQPKEGYSSMPLSELCSLITKQTGFDYAATIKPSLVRENKGEVCPFIQNKDFSGTSFNYDTDYYVPLSVVKRFPRITLNHPCLLFSISGAIGNVGLYLDNKVAFIGGAIAICHLIEGTINYKYLLYFLLSHYGQSQISGAVKAASHANVTVESIRKIIIQFPSLQEQERIVSILDRFDVLTNDLTTGLPAEIEKRRQQYEYYRDKLLTFKRKEA